MSLITPSSLEARRRLLQLGACGAMTNTTAMSAMLNMKLTSAALATTAVPTTGYKALVCVFLNGAIDGFQVLTPFGAATNDTAYANYVASRTQASLKREDPSNPGFPGGGWDTAGSAPGGAGGGVIAAGEYGYLQRITNNFTSNGNPQFLGLHPRFTRLKAIYDAGHATFIANVGSLIEPIFDPANPTATQTNFNSASRRKPIGLFSHPDLQRHWQTAFPTSRNQVKGWGGKMADLLTDDAAVAPAKFYSAVSTLGSNIWQTGARVRPYAVAGQSSATNIGGATLMGGYAIPGSSEYNGSGFTAPDRIYSDLQTDYVNQTYADLLEKSVLAARVDARDAADTFQSQISAVTLPSGPGIRPFDNSGLGSQLATVARAIKARANLGFASGGRQIFMVQVGGWDHHATLLESQHTMIGGGRNAVDGAGGIDAGLKSFYDFLQAEGLFNDVTTFTISDFGRTISYNGSGSDHAWGNNMIVMGGSLTTNPANGGTPRIFGNYPSVTLGTNQPQRLDTSTRGTYVPTTSTDQMYYELARWFGLQHSNIIGTVSSGVGDGILPYGHRFNLTGGPGGKPIGFLNY